MAELASQRWQAIDPLLPAVTGWTPDCGADLAVDGQGGGLVAAASCLHWTVEPGSLDLIESPPQRFLLMPYFTGSDVLTALDTLLSRWRDHLAAVPEAAADDTTAVIRWPSRDVTGVPALLAHGLTPFGVVAARSVRRAPAVVADCPLGVRIRRATPADVDVVLAMTMEVLRFDAYFGVMEPPGVEQALRAQVAGLLEGDPWTWLAEREGNPVGMLIAERPESATWIAPRTSGSPVAYLLALHVAPAERGAGVGAALTWQLHRSAEAAGVSVILLEYEQVNPLSVPFWGRQGYRPLWSTWEVRPARLLR
ncbi:MAG TPA: GNAT family N-acetyltransferase [Trebonia sp.]|nr:GNAT family N-acetyltransferase [Trebonia sp.]